MRSKEVLLVATSKPSARLILNRFYNSRTNKTELGFSSDNVKVQYAFLTREHSRLHRYVLGPKRN